MLTRSIARKTASKWTVRVCQNCDKKTETIDRHTLSLALRKFAMISVSFRIIMAEMAVFYVTGYLIEERRRWPVITASPRGQCYK